MRRSQFKVIEASLYILDEKRCGSQLIREGEISIE